MGKSILISSINIGSEIKNLFVEVQEEYGEYLTDDIADAFLVMILPYAMMKARKEKVIIKEEIKNIYKEKEEKKDIKEQIIIDNKKDIIHNSDKSQFDHQ